MFRIYVIETKVGFVSFDNENLQRRRKLVCERDFPVQNSYTPTYWSCSMSESQQGPEICDVISAKRYNMEYVLDRWRF